MKRHLILRLEAPLMAFGGVLVDNYGVTRDFPAISMLTGLIANALGWHRRDSEQLQALQDRLVFASRLDKEPGILHDTQNAQIYQKDQGWTTWGTPEGRENSPSYKGIDDETPQRGKYLLQRRYRDYHADASISIALRLEPDAAHPNLEDIAQAFDHPARPLFLGRKSCLPSRPLLDPEADRWVFANTVYEALCKTTSLAPHMPKQEAYRAQWPQGEGPQGDRAQTLSDRRNWRSGVHAGRRPINEGRIEAPATAGESQ
ncbi:type I-E CRISPR-associated protein Cas5/CasD [Iodidimonas gelatinilytica]|uniref:Type I-E CRISPR-associated protein Cas5/CasD n=1 Tax=Iodidimonas gelatinilytica TaxID=1236966 RepID=A0A5A7MRK2_9PROT|nr:type I-E CRISPR-associated protein Cas5/CasD [Iodidimonas gelatinilytica]GEQ98234.1 type I-E CRISPR-associated protein Cas5/CasD [Iodidimonas gelatinilytica]